MVERLILLATEGEVTGDTVEMALPRGLTSAASPAGSGTLAERAQGFEREVILAELKRSHFHVTNAAKALGLERSHLYKKAEQLGIDLRPCATTRRNDSNFHRFKSPIGPIRKYRRNCIGCP